MVEDRDLDGKVVVREADGAGNRSPQGRGSRSRRIAGEVVFEPVMGGVRVTARDEQQRVLWGFIGSKGMLDQILCRVAVYGTLQALLTEELREYRLPAPEDGDPIQAAKQALSVLGDTIGKLSKSITVKKVSEATLERAAAIARIVSDANRMIALETVSFKALKEQVDADEQ
jgi:hypothetical protein